MSTTYLEMCQRVRQKCSVGSSGPTTVTSQTGMLKNIVDWVANDWLWIQNKRPDWLFMWEDFDDESTAVGVTEYDLGRLRGDLFLDGTALSYYDYDSFRDLVDYGDIESITGDPIYWTIRPDKQIKIAPAPTEIGTLSGERYGDPQTLSVDADVISLPDEYLDVIFWKAVQSYAIHEEAVFLYQVSTEEFNSMYAKLCNEQLPPVEFSGAMV